MISIACSSGTPAPIRAENVRDQRARATLWKISPILNGTRSRKRCQIERPLGVFFHFEKAKAPTIVPKMSRYQ